MSDTLFEQYPAKPAKTRKGQGHEAPPCCDHWARFAATNEGADADQATRIVHRFGHSLTPFTVDAVIDLAGCNRVDARRAIDTGVRHDWLRILTKKDKYDPNDPDRWVGKL